MLKICKKNKDFIKGETIIHSYYRCLSYILIKKFLIKTSITPNQITIFRNILMIASFYFFYKMNYLFFVGFFLFQVSELLDSTDGDLARMKNMKSKKGIWLEIFFDSILTPVWGILGLLFVYIFYKTDGNCIYFIFWGLIGFANNLEKNFYIKFMGNSKSFSEANHQLKYYGFKKEPFIIKIRNFIILLKVWENQLLLIVYMIYLIFGINLFILAWVIILLLNQLHWIRIAYYGYKTAFN